MLHFSIQTDLERERIKFRKLNKIGITSKDVARIIGGPLKVLFFLPYALGIALSSFYVVSSSRVEMSTALEPMWFCLLVGGAYLLFQVLFIVYTPNYTLAICWLISDCLMFPQRIIQDVNLIPIMIILTNKIVGDSI